MQITDFFNLEKKTTSSPSNHRNRVASGAATKTTKKSGVTANLVKPGDVDTSGSDLEIRLSSPKRPDRDRVPKIPQFSTLASGGAVYPTGKEPADENTPTYWSASELLEKHEQVIERVQSGTRSPEVCRSKMKIIPEDIDQK